MSETTVQLSLAQDHDRLDQLLDTYRRLKRKDFAAAKQAFREFKFGLQKHIIFEETVLFPLFEDKSGMRGYGPTVVMRAEHRQIGALLEALHDKVRRQDVESEREEEELRQALFLHNQKEENVLYPTLDRLTTEEERAKAFQKFQTLPEEAYRTCCGHRAHPSQEPPPSH
jgi:regulator of cell morphogenesis and NO signaling